MYKLIRHEKRTRAFIPIFISSFFIYRFLSSEEYYIAIKRSQSFSDFLTIENAIVSFFSIMIIFAIKSFFQPYHFISCNYKGVYIGKKKQFFNWEQIADISEGQIQTGGKINDPKYSPAIIIKLTDDLFEHGIFMHEHAKYISQNTFTFKDDNPEETINSILKFWTNEHQPSVKSKMDPEIQQLLESGDKLNALKLCKEKLNLSLKESKEYIEKNT